MNNSSILSLLWQRIPVTRRRKEIIKDFLFTSFPYVFSSWKSYIYWKDARIFMVDNPDSEGLPSLTINETPLSEIHRIAVIIHAFYADVFIEIIDLLKKNPPELYELYISCPALLTSQLEETLKKTRIRYNLKPTENKGRDVLPFLLCLEDALQDGHTLFLKIHTKKSNRRKSGKIWRNDLYDKLLNENTLSKVLSLFNADQKIGLMTAEGHLIPMNLYYGANARRTEELGRRMRASGQQLKNLIFAAGSMFYIRKEALTPLLNLNLHSVDFEPELGQVDGTLAHALERTFALSTTLAGFKLVDTSYSTDNQNITICYNYTYTW